MTINLLAVDEFEQLDAVLNAEAGLDLLDEGLLGGWATNAFCATGPGGGVNPHCSPKSGKTYDLHTSAGLVDYLKDHLDAKHKMTAGTLAKVAHLHPNGIQGGKFFIPYPWADVTGQHAKNQAKIDDLMNLLPAGTMISHKRVSHKDIAAASIITPQPVPSVTAPLGRGANVVGGVPAAGVLKDVPMADKTTFESGKAQPGLTLNGVPFAAAPPKFWEHVKDVDVKEPPALSKIDRVGIMVQEPDGRVWIASPTNGFGNRKYTLPGGGVEHGLTTQQNALKEVWEETGLQVEITGHLGDFKDSNNGNNGRLYIGRRIGGQPWDAKVEDGKHGGPVIRSNKTGQFAAESEEVHLVTKDQAMKMLHRTDDLAQLHAVHPIPLDMPTNGTGSEPLKKLVAGMRPAVQHYIDQQKAKGNWNAYKNSINGSADLHVAQELRGFNALPKVVSKADMDDLVKQGTHVEMIRGLRGAGGKSAKDLADEFKTGDHFPGTGVFGAGTYCDAMPGTSNVAAPGNSYSGTVTMRMALPKTAKIISAAELQRKVPKPPPGVSKSCCNGSDDSNWWGVQATLAGYDAIHVDRPTPAQGTYGCKQNYQPQDFHIILNRGALVVQREDAKGHIIR